MGPVSAEVEVDVPREAAFALIGDLSRRPFFTDHFLSDLHLTRIEPTGVGAGARFRFHVPLNSVWVETTIVVAEPHRIVEQGRGGRENRVPSTTVWDLTGAPGSLTKIRVAYWTEPSHRLERIREGLTASSIWCERAWREALRRLRFVLESGSPDGRRVTVAGGNRLATGVP